ncbi:hypothetical protein CTA2_12005 [Colletotrichum tanaceti]|nr:hypothetical protein CTA2_12005 [Colletotrichum tanaceti]
MLIKNGDVNADVKAVITAEIDQIKTWVDEFYGGKGKCKRRVAEASDLL